jgi:hypothetical protein
MGEQVVDIAAGDITSICVYEEVLFSALLCNIEMLTFRFDDNTGYICSLSTDAGQCFDSKNPFFVRDYQSIDGNRFVFQITQQDSENGLQIP